MKEYTDISLRHLDLSDNFFDLVQAVLQENINQGNITTGFFKATNDPQERDKEYRSQTKWSDNRLIIPVLFNLFHGIELFLKGIKYLHNIPEFDKKNRPNHNLTHLLADFKKEYPKKTTLIDIFEFYIHPNDDCPILLDFYKENEIIDSSGYIETFKYPSNKNFAKQYNFKDLRRNGNKGIEFFEKIINDIDKLRDEKRNFE